jgi:6,7-dimethyl-8-ribityllumazine synthase
MSSESYKVDSNNIPDASNLKIGIVVSMWNNSITNNLLKGSIALLESKKYCSRKYSNYLRSWKF